MNQFCELILDYLQDVEIVEDGAKHTLILYNCKVPLTGELLYSAADAKCSANLKVKGERSQYFICALLQTGMICADSFILNLASNFKYHKKFNAFQYNIRVNMVLKSKSSFVLFVILY